MFSWKKKFNISGGEKSSDSKSESKQKSPKLTSKKSSDSTPTSNEQNKHGSQPVEPVSSASRVSNNAENDNKAPNGIPTHSKSTEETSDHPNNIGMSGLSISSSNNQSDDPTIDAKPEQPQSGSSGILTLKIYSGDGFALPFPLVYNPQLLTRLLNSSADKQPSSKIQELNSLMENLRLSDQLEDSNSIPGHIATKFVPSTIMLPGSKNLNPLIYFTVEFDNTAATIQPESGTMDHPVFNKISTFDVTRKMKNLRIDVFCRIPSILLSQSLINNAGNDPTLQKVINNQDVHLLSFDLPLNLQDYTLNSVRLFNHKWVQLGENGSRLNITVDYKPSVNKKLSIDDFELLKVIGKGSFGKVMQVKKKDTQKIYALKALRKAYIVNNSEIVHTLAERTVLARIDCPFIVPLKFSFQSKEKLYLVLALINGGELFYHLQREGRFSLSRSRFYTAELLIALESLHAMNIVYRDLKPENILLDYQGHIALCDFGLCKLDMKKDDKTATFCGTPEYLAPELLIGHGYTRVVDWWTLGVLLYEMLTGLPPYYDNDVPKMYKKILQDPLRFPDGFDEDAKDLLIKLLNRDPAKRLGANGSSEIKKHPFFSQLSWKRLILKGYIPPYKPSVEGNLDTSNFDAEFTSERPVDSVVNDYLSESVQKQFGGWTYVGNEQLDSTQ
ncbi:probable Serine/threonine-protein kinase YPK1 [Hanseniaspora guilliermondii]|uniref:non-specific serine/threonine protein kinase n=1 Tax=Hanseniaspora guilliermondii TaxID=56406 RepID=A0A1L0FE30_9ASCO|nr:probable Serine/threonine-protein kinase YPK1 [Hanseniaspora guilliermondii]